jgi:hypothetical protein
MQQTGFSDTAWGKATHGYTRLTHALANTKFGAIIKDAQEFMKLIHTHNRDPTEVIDIDNDNNDNDDNKGHSWLITPALKQSVCGFPLS